MKILKNKKSLKNLANGRLEGGFEVLTKNVFIFGALANNGCPTNNCNGGNCSPNCGLGQNTVPGCGAK